MAVHFPQRANSPHLFRTKQFAMVLLTWLPVLGATPYWEWAYPQPTGQTLNGVAISPSGGAVAVGSYGAIYRIEHDGTWSQHSPNFTQKPLFGIAFSPSGIAVAVGESGTVLRSSNGGREWGEVDYGTKTSLLNDVTFADSDTVIAVGNNGSILRSMDSGKTWARNLVPTIPTGLSHLQALHFSDAGIGIIVGDGGEILRTTDKGKTWARLSYSHQGVRGVRDLKGVAFASSDVASIVGDQVVLHSTDAGLTWTRIAQQATTTHRLYSVGFQDSLRGFAAGVDQDDPSGKSGILLQTLDGGATWSPAAYPTDTRNLRGLAVGVSRFLAVGAQGELLTGTPDSLPWVSPAGRYPAAGSHLAIAFANDTIGMATGSGGHLSMTSNGGKTWVEAPQSFGGKTIWAITIADTANGAAVGAEGHIWYTRNAGDSWSQSQHPVAIRPFSSFAWRAVAFADSRIGVVAGDSGRMLRTEDGGQTWTNITVVPPDPLSVFEFKWNGMAFANHNNGIAVGSGGTIYRTSNAGISWQAVSHGQSAHLLTSVAFADSSIGIVVGANSTLLRTTDGGGSWQSIWNEFGDLYAVRFADASYAVAVGQGGQAIHSFDAGATWASMSQKLTSNDLYDIAFLDGRHGIVAAFGYGLVRFAPESPSNQVQKQTIRQMASVSNLQVLRSQSQLGVTFDLANPGRVGIRLLDYSGRVVRSGHQWFPAGRAYYPVSAEWVAQGPLLVELRSGRDALHRKVPAATPTGSR